LPIPHAIETPEADVLAGLQAVDWAEGSRCFSGTNIVVEDSSPISCMLTANMDFPETIEIGIVDEDPRPDRRSFVIECVHRI
jgi:hypothetical protein